MAIIVVVISIACRDVFFLLFVSFLKKKKDNNYSPGMDRGTERGLGRS
jgi:hypothetical protein